MERQRVALETDSPKKSAKEIIVLIVNMGLAAGLASKAGVTNRDHLRTIQTVPFKLAGLVVRETINSVRERLQ